MSTKPGLLEAANAAPVIAAPVIAAPVIPALAIPAIVAAAVEEAAAPEAPVAPMELDEKDAAAVAPIPAPIPAPPVQQARRKSARCRRVRSLSF